MNNENETLTVWINGGMKPEEGTPSREPNSWGMKWCSSSVFYFENLHMSTIHLVQYSRQGWWRHAFVDLAANYHNHWWSI